MFNARNSHRNAMEIADRGFISLRMGEYDSAIQLFTDAFELELQAANLVTSEPGRSVFFRSAATLALHARLYREAEKAIAQGLAGDPPPEIAKELREVFERVNFHRHLSLNGIQLNPEELQLSITGNVISKGMALTGAIFNRVQNLEKIVIRTAQRINERPFGKYTLGDLYPLYMSSAREGSFAVTLRIGEPQQMQLPSLDNRPQVIDEVIHNLNLLNDNRMEDLKNTIQDKSYLESFLGLAKNLAPDGEDVRMVGLTVLRNGSEASVGLSIRSKDIKPYLLTEIDEPELLSGGTEMFQITGELLYAEAMKKNLIKIVDDTGKTHSILVSQAIAEDVVKPYFGSRVTVDVTRENKKQLIFRDINSAQ